MEIEKIKKVQEEIDNKYQDKYGENCSSDGIINIEKYCKTSPKILWILKEINDEDGYDQKYELNKMVIEVLESNSLNESNRKAWYKTLDPIIYTSYQIFNGYIHYEDHSMDYIKDNPLMVETLQKIAFMNVKKQPGDARANNIQIQEWYDKTKDLLKEQIELINPDIIIGGSTLYLFQEDFKLDFIGESIKYAIKDNRIWVDAYHPNQTQITREKYCDSIMECVKENINNIHLRV